MRFSINRTIISDGLSVPESPGAIWAVFGPLRARPGTGRFREARATEIAIDASGRASDDVDTKRDEKKKSDAGAKGDKKGKNGTKAVKAKGGVKKTSSKPKAKQAAAPEPTGEPAAVVPAAAEAPTLEPKPEPVQA